MSSVARIVASLSSLAVLVSATAAQAAPPSTAQCLDAAERSEALRDEGKLTAARTLLLVCASEACPAVVRTECIRMLEDVTKRTPTIVVRARDAAGHDLIDVQTFVDNTLRSPTSDGRALFVDAGVHVIRFVRPSGASSEQTIVAREGERDRVVDVIFAVEAASPPHAATPLEATGPAVTSEQTKALAEPHRVIPWTSVAALGVAVVGAGAFAYFANAASHDVDDMRARCAPACPSSDVSSARTQLIVANTSAVIAVVALGAAVVFYLSQPAASQARTAWWALSPRF